MNRRQQKALGRLGGSSTERGLDARTDNTVAARGLAMAADMLSEFESAVRTMVTKPAIAGHS
jgi:hypothetical protein